MARTLKPMKSKIKLIASSDHLHYEIWMLRMLAYRILNINFGDDSLQSENIQTTKQQLVTHTSSPQIYLYSSDAPISPPSNNENDTVIGNALLESFTIHLRSLIDFFYLDSMNAKSDDVLAEHFFTDHDRWKQCRPYHSKEQLAKIKNRVSKEVAHLTYTRNQSVKILKDWPIFEYKELIFEALKVFLSCVDKSLISDKWNNFH